MSKTYNTPAAFQAALNQQAKAIVKQQGGTVAAVMRGFYFQRLTARVFQHDPQGGY
ncbi:hypothetical protein NKH18_33130 [Streptomyces sp. M10(2022)]